MAGVAPLRPDPRGRVRRPPLRTPPPRLATAPSTVSVEQAGAPPDAFAAPGVNRREIRKLKRGDYRAEDTLDLHGRSVAVAKKDVARFIENSRHARLRCVCIVHGRGLNSAGGVPVLKGEVRARLMAMPDVLAYADAPASAGGAGAVCVLLRR
jgi:DNA-nicking Smr family endonuclease